MKKIVLAVMTMLSVTAGFAANENENVADARKYTIEVNVSRLSRTLDLKVDQYDAMLSGEQTFAEETRAAGRCKTTEKRNAYLRKAVYRNLKYMQGVLDKEQYRKYLSILNVTLANRGIAF